MAQTKTVEKPTLVAEPATSKGEVVAFAAPRLPWHPAIEERFGVDRSGWKTLVEAIYPNAKSADAIAMVLAYCKSRDLDPFKRVAHIVPMWSSEKRAMIETVWPGIAELRTTAFRTGQYAGCGEAEFGPTIEEEFQGESGTERRSATIMFPEWCRVTIKRTLGGAERIFVGPKVYWLETYARWKNTDVPNDMWRKRPAGQLEKCAEAAALRRAFPEELGNDYAAEEMEGRTVLGEHAAAEAIPPQPPAAAPAAGEVVWGDEAAGNPPGQAAGAGAGAEADGAAEQSGIREPAPTPPSAPAPEAGDGLEIPPYLKREPDANTKGRAAPKPGKPPRFLTDRGAFDERAWKIEIERIVTSAVNDDTLIEMQQQICTPNKKSISAEGWEWHVNLIRARRQRLEDETRKPAAAATDGLDDDALDPAQWLRDIEGALGAVEGDIAALDKVKNGVLLPQKGKMPPADWQKAVAMYRAKVAELQNAL